MNRRTVLTSVFRWAFLFVAMLMPRIVVAAERPISLAFGAGGSAYQGGVAHALLSALRAESGQMAWEGAIAGVSSGGVNAVLAALTRCLKDEASLGPEDSLMWKTWKRVSFEQFFPGDRTCEEYREEFPQLEVECTDVHPYTPRDGVLTLNGFSDVRQTFLRTLSDRSLFRANCMRIPVTVPLFAETQSTLKTGNFEVRSSRRHVVVNMGTSATGAVELCLPYSDSSVGGESVLGGRRLLFPSSRPYPETHLIEENRRDAKHCQPVSPEFLVDAVVASSSLPPLFTPIPLLHCGTECPGVKSPGLYCPDGQHVCETRFADGALFDHIPLSAALDVAPPSSRFVLLESRAQPGSYADRRDREQPLPAGLRGADFYADVGRSFFDVTADYELQTLIRYRHGELDVQRLFRATPVFGDFMYGFGTFLDPLMTQYDYFTGIYDAIQWLQIDKGIQMLAGHATIAQDSTALSLSGRLDSFVSAYGEEIGFWPAGMDGVMERSTVSDRLHLRKSRAASYVVALHMYSDYCAGGELETMAHCRAIKTFLERQRLRNDDLRGLWLLHEALRTSAVKPYVANGVPVFLDDIEPVVAALHRVEDENRCDDGPPDWSESRRFLDKHTMWYANVRRQFASRMADIERSENAQIAPLVAGAVQYTSAVQASLEDRGWQLGSSSIPWSVLGTDTYHIVGRMLGPHTFSAGLAQGGFRVGWDVLGYRFKKPIFPAIVVGSTLNYFRYTPVKDRGWAGGPTLALNWRTDIASLAEFGVRGLYFPWQRDERLQEIGADLFVRPLWGRLEVAVGFRNVAAWNTNELIVNFGLADLNGLIYWALRSSTGDDDVYGQLVRQAAGRVVP